MAAFPIIAVAIALIVIGRLGNRLNFHERKRDRIARQISFYAGLAILVVYFGWWLI